MKSFSGHFPIFLTGFMGSGKSTIGRSMSQLTQIPLLELDDCIERLSKSSITEIFNESGEEGFRQIETEALHNLDLKSKLIVSTGGGTPVFNDNMEWMIKRGCVVHLQCRPGVLFHRLAPEKLQRPLLSSLSDTELMVFIIDVLKNRLPFYSKAHLEVNAEKTPDEVAKEIINKLKIPLTNF